MFYRILLLFSIGLSILGCGEGKKTSFTPLNIKAPSDLNIVQFIKKDGSKISEALEKFPKADIDSITHIIFSKDHWFIKENPLLNEKERINLRRHIIWDKELVAEEHEGSAVLFRIAGSIPQTTFKTLNPSQLFGEDFKKDQLGQGGEGAVYKVKYKGNDYALKENAKEFASMERLFFTKGVLEAYGYFMHNNNIYMIMPLAKGGTLDEKIKKNEVFIPTVEDLERLYSLLKASEELQIPNNDIKPHNIVFLDNTPMFIDISDFDTRAYSGKPAFKLLHSLLEAMSLKSFRGGYIRLDRYYEFDEDYRSNNVASDDYLAYFFMYVCKKENIAQDCEAIRDFNSLYDAMTKQKKYDLALKLNRRYNDETGTKDQKLGDGGIYDTLLDYPQFLEEKTIDYKPYFDKKDTIIKSFCKNINVKIPYHHRNFFEELIPDYKDECIGDEPKLLKKFNNPNDKGFQKFIMDAFSPMVKYNLFTQIAQLDNREEVFKLILDEESKINNWPVELTNSLKQLLE